MEGAIRDDRDHIKNLEKDIKDNESKLSKLKDDFKDDVKEEMRGSYGEDDVEEGMRGSYGEDDVEEGMRGTYEDDDIKEADEVDIDVEDDIDIDDVSDKSEIEVDSELSGESADISAILGLLTKAQEEAKALGDEKLLDQIGNTITYYTRAHVVATNEEQGMDPERFVGSGGDEIDSDSIVNVTKDNPAEDAEIGFALDESIQRFAKLAGLEK